MSKPIFSGKIKENISKYHLLKFYQAWRALNYLMHRMTDSAHFAVIKWHTFAFKGWGSNVLFHMVHPIITKTCLYNFDPFKPYFYIVKLGFTGVYIIFLISAQNIDCGYSLELPRRGGSNEYPQSMFWAEIWKISELFIWKLSVFGGNIFNIFERACFRNVMLQRRSSNQHKLLYENCNSCM